MIAIGIDPSLVCTGVAVTTLGVAGKLHVMELVLVRPDGHDLVQRIISLRNQLERVLDWHRAAETVACVETPATKGRSPKAWGYGGRNVLTLPTYGCAVAAAILAVAAAEVPLWTTPADELARGLPGSRIDRHKTHRVQLACSVSGLQPKDLGPKSDASNAADAILLAWHAISRGEKGVQLVCGRALPEKEAKT